MRRRGVEAEDAGVAGGRLAVALEGLDGAVLPAPLGQRRVCTWPASAVSERSATAVTGP